MRLSLKGMAIASGLIWGAAILCVAIIHLADPNYGVSFLQMTSSVYPGFHAAGTLGRIALGTVEGIVDGAITGLVLAWIYNHFTQVPSVG
ncbi:MAG TPA: hypothetical protein VE263_21355 [Candidatus Angelobacter sp.]|nr:hypothetical protein [Candidatus Angelobacter sp.]